MKIESRILFLTLDGFSNIGGIQSVCKSMAFTLNSISVKSDNTEFTNLSLYDDVADKAYVKDCNFQGYRGNRIAFLINALRKGRCSNTIIISHINLLAIGLLIKLLNRNCQIIMLAHGAEIWRSIKYWKLNFIRSAVTIWSVSKHTKDILVKRHRVKSSSVFILNNCLDPFHPNPKRLDKPKDLLELHLLSAFQPTLISVCRMSKHDWQKGYDLTLHVLPKIRVEFPNIHYFMIGQIEPLELIRINTLIDTLDIKQHVTLLGYVTDVNLAKYYLLADIFVLPSAKEGFGLVFIEAASFGCAVISGDQDGSKEALMNGKLGVSVKLTSQNLAIQIAKSLRKGRNADARRITRKHCLNQFSQSKYEDNVKILLK